MFLTARLCLATRQSLCPGTRWTS